MPPPPPCEAAEPARGWRSPGGGAPDPSPPPPPVQLRQKLRELPALLRSGLTLRRKSAAAAGHRVSCRGRMEGGMQGEREGCREPAGCAPAAACPPGPARGARGGAVPVGPRRRRGDAAGEPRGEMRGVPGRRWRPPADKPNSARRCPPPSCSSLLPLPAWQDSRGPGTCGSLGAEVVASSARSSGGFWAPAGCEWGCGVGGPRCGLLRFGEG